MSEAAALEKDFGGETTEVRPALSHTAGVQHARLLVVSPDPHMADALRAEMTLAGYTAVCAHDAASALASVQAQPPDLVLLSVCAAHGFSKAAASALAQSLKAAADGVFLPVLALTETPIQDDWTAGGVDDALFRAAADASPLLGLRVATLLHLKRRHQALRDSIAETEATCAAAQQTANRFEAVFQQNAEAMLLVDSDGRIMQANECACALLSCEPDALDGRPLASLCPPELSWADALLSQGASRSFSDKETSLLTPSGLVIAAEVRSAPIQPAFQPGTVMSEPGLTLLVVTLHDRRPARARLAEAQRAASAETEAALRREINNPLFVISSNVELLQNALQSEDSRVQAKLARVADAARRLAQVSLPPMTLSPSNDD